MRYETRKILVVDDDKDMREMLTTLLTMKGYHVKAVPDITNEIAENKPGLIILDVMLSGKNGIDICKALKKDKTTSDIPVIMISALMDIERDCLNAGADDFLHKPFSVRSFTDSINQQLLLRVSL